MIRNKAYRYELNPNRNQRQMLSKHSGAARFAYNWSLARRMELYEQTKKSTNAIAEHKALNALKKTDFLWMYEVSKCAPQEALRDLDKAFQHFFRGLKQKRKVGFPKFKKKGIHDSFRLTGSIHVTDRAVQLPRLGRVKTKEAISLEGRILSATVSREADRWYVSLSVVQEVEMPQPIRNGKIVGIDLGLHHFAVLSDGTKIEATKPLMKLLKRLRKRSKEHSRKQKGSSNRKKSAMRLARLHCRIRNIRTDFLHKFTTQLAKTKQEIVIEDLNVKGMTRNKRLAKHIADAGWGEARRMLAYKTEWYGSQLTVIPPFEPTSKLCSACGYKMEDMPLSVRAWECPSCGTDHDRDENAAKNIRSHAKTA